MRAFIFAFVTLIAVFSLPPHARAQDCTDPDGVLGNIVYNADYGVFQGCTPAGWRGFHAPTASPTPTGCPNIGDTCNDDSIYAGTTVGGAKMYVTRCDAGISWDEGLGACTGTQSLIRWDNVNCNQCGDGATTGIDSLDDGMANVAAMRAWVEGNTADGDLNGFDAARYCDGLSGAGGHGRDDWYLPAKNELVTIWNNLADGAPDADGDDISDDFYFDISGDNPNSSYWSSSEGGSIDARGVRFSDGVQTNTNKSNTYAVRCARRD